MRLKREFELMEIDGESFAVSMEEAADGFNGVIRLSGTAAAIFRLLQQETTEEEIVAQMRRRYRVDDEVLSADVHKVLAKLREKGLLAG